jgi:succinoglycan biosynthesis transport protein ExoP
MALYDSSAPKLYPTTSASPTQEDRMDAQEVVKILRRRRTLILTTILLLTGLSILLAYSMTPLYTATSTVVVDSRATRLIDAEAVLEEQAQDRAMVETQIKLLESRSFLRQVIQRVGLLEDPEFNAALRGDQGISDLLLQHLSMLTAWLPESWRVGTWLVETGLATPSLPSGSAAKTEPEPNPDGDSLERALNRFLSRLTVAQLGEAWVLSIQFTSPDPAKAALISNAVAELYVALQLENKQSAAARSASWLSERLAELRTELLRSESAIAAYRDEHELIDSNGTTLDSVQLAALHAELIATRAELAEMRSKLGALRALRATGEGFETISEVVASPVIASLRQQQTTLLRERAQLSQEYGPRHPSIIQLEAEQREIELKIQIEIQNIVSAFERDVTFVQTREQMLRESLDEAKTTVAGHKRAEVQLGELQREADANSALYKAFLERFKKLNEQQGVLQPGIQVISRAAPPTSPSFPRPPLIIVVGFTGSLVIATLLAFIAESLESGLRSARQIEKALRVSSLGLVPRVNRAKGKLKLHQYLIQKPRSDYAEAVRAVQIGLQYTNIDRPPQIVLVTSSLPSEGKTTLTLSLGASAAASGHKTVVVDLDLRHPSVRRELKQPATAPGLVEFIAGEATLDQVVHVDEAQPNLHIITVRRNPANPIDLLSSQKMAALMAQLRSRYKYIILDAPPLLGISDTRVAVYLADAVLFVVRWGKTKAEVAQNGMAALIECRAPVAGAVLTQVNLRRHAKRAYGDAVQYYGKYKQYYIN